MKKLFTALALCLLASVSFAKTLKIQIPFAPGYYGDLHARSLAEYLTKHGHETIVVNSTTGGGNLAMDTVANDRNSTVITQAGAGYLSFYTTTRNPYGDIQTKFVYPIGWNQWVVYTKADTVFTGPASFNQASYASSGVGSSSHLFFAKISQDLNADMIHLPYKGSSAAALDVAAGRVTYMIDTAQAGERLAGMGIRPLFILANQRSPFYANIPTAKEVGVRSLEGMYDYSTLYYVMNANFDPVLKREIIKLLDQHNHQYSPAEFEQKFGVIRPETLNTDTVDSNLKQQSRRVIELQQQFIK
jgi:tripartite-type tricarboxylate transporter receptor subunit TctC